MIRPGRLLWLFRRDLRRGWNATRQHYFTLPRIERWSWPFWDAEPVKVPIHLLTGAKDWQLAAWMLASFFQFSENTWPVVVHDDGTLPKEAQETLGKLFKKARFISRAEADAVMGPVLKAYPFCHEYRSKHPLALKAFDVPHFAEGDRFMVFDSDVLFFSYPAEIVNWAKSKSDECFFNEDVAEGALLTAQEAKKDLNVDLWSRVNSGLCLLNKAVIDLDFCDRALAETDIMRGHVWRIEQTLLALCASRHGKGGLLPRKYEVSLGKRAADNAVARHYVGAVRDRFYGEGLKRIAPVLLAKEA